MNGTHRRFPAERNLVLDICRAARSVPCFPVEKILFLESTCQARACTAKRISWCAIFVKAWARVGQEFHPLRESYISLPWQRLYRHQNTVANITVHRDDSPCAGGELIWCRIPSPETRSLNEIQEIIDHTRTAPIDEVFREGKRIAAYPMLLRRALWHLVMRWWGYKKAKKLGTFSISSLAGVGARNFLHPLVVTTSLEFGIVDPATGRCCLTLLCDHRVLDGMLAARALVRLEEILRTEIVQELQLLSNQNQQAA